MYWIIDYESYDAKEVSEAVQPDPNSFFYTEEAALIALRNGIATSEWSDLLGWRIDKINRRLREIKPNLEEN